MTAENAVQPKPNPASETKQCHKLTLLFQNHPEKRVVLEIEEGTSILHACMENAIHLQHNCGGVCACSTCHVIIKSGMENLPEMSDDEEEQLDEAVGLTLASRLGCQSKVYGDITAVIPDQTIYLGH
jgi:2Fe-2S ferredoxin